MSESPVSIRVIAKGNTNCPGNGTVTYLAGATVFTRKAGEVVVMAAFNKTAGHSLGWSPSQTAGIADCMIALENNGTADTFRMLAYTALGSADSDLDWAVIGMMGP